VLAPRGRLVAITNGRDHLLELWAVVGAEDARLGRVFSFGAENGADALRPHFAHVEMREAGGSVRIADRDAIARYLRSTTAWAPLADRLPDDVPLPLVARRSNVVFVADKA